MTQHSTATELDAQPRAQGAARLSAKRVDGASRIDALAMSGSLKLLFPRPAGPALEAVMVNTAGGITGGDQFTCDGEAGAGAALSLTTQAAERVYRAAGANPGRLSTKLSVQAGASLAWLPQETILFDGAHLKRRLSVDLAEDARFLMVEPLVFGRAAMGESLHAARFDDRVEIRRAGQPIWLDAVQLDGDIAAQMGRKALGDGARAMASLVYIAPDAEALRDPLRALLPETAGASLIGENMLVARLLAPDSYDLRRALVPAIKLLNSNEIPKPWML